MRHVVGSGDESSPLPRKQHHHQQQYGSSGSTALQIVDSGSKSSPANNGHHHRNHQQQLSPQPSQYHVSPQYRAYPQRRRIWFEWSYDNDDEDDTPPLDTDINVDAVSGEFELVLDLRDEICFHLGAGVLGDRGPSSVLLYADPRHVTGEQQQQSSSPGGGGGGGGLFPIPLSKSLEDALGDQYSLNPSSSPAALLIRVRIYDRANSVRNQSPMQRSSSALSTGTGRRLNSPTPYHTSSIRSRPHTPPLRRAPSPIPMPTTTTTRTSPDATVQKKALRAYPPPPQQQQTRSECVAPKYQDQQETPPKKAVAPLNGTLVVVAEDQSEIPDDVEDAIEAQFDAGYAKFRSRTGGSTQREQSEEARRTNPGNNNNSRAGRQGNAGRGRSPLTPHVPHNMEVYTNNNSQEQYGSPLSSTAVMTPAPPRPTSAHPRTSHTSTTTTTNPRMYSEPQQHNTTTTISSPQQPLTPHRPQTAGPRSLHIQNSTSSPTMTTNQQTAKNAYSFKYRSEFAVQEFVMNKGWAAILKEQEEEVRAVTGGPLFGKTAWASRPSSAISYREASYSPPTTSAMTRRRSNNNNNIVVGGKPVGMMDVEPSDGSGRTGDSGLTASSTLLRTPGEATRSSQERCWEDEGRIAERARTYVAVSVDEDVSTSPRPDDNVVVGYDDDEEDHIMEQQHQSASTTSTPPKRASISSQRPLTPTSLRSMLALTPHSDNATTAAPQHSHARRTPTPVATNLHEQQRPQSIIHEVDSRSVSAVHVDGYQPPSTTHHHHHEEDGAISERSFRSNQQEQLSHPFAHDDEGEEEEHDDKMTPDSEGLDDDEDDIVPTDDEEEEDVEDDQTLEEVDEEEATPASTDHDDLEEDDEEEDIDDEEDDSENNAMPDDVAETLPGTGISELDMALLEGTPNPTPASTTALYPSSIVASPPTSPSPSRFRIAPRAITPTSTTPVSSSPHSEEGDVENGKPITNEADAFPTTEEDTADEDIINTSSNTNTNHQLTTTDERLLRVEQEEGDQRTTLVFNEEEGYHHLVDIEGQVVTSLARLADARAFIATEEVVETPIPATSTDAMPEEEFSVDKDDDAPTAITTAPKEDVIIAPTTVENGDDPDVEISPVPSDDEKLEDDTTAAGPPVHTTPHYAEEAADDHDDDGISPPTTPQPSVVFNGIESAPPTIDIELKRGSVEEDTPPTAATTTTVVSNLAIPSAYPLDDISQNVSAANSATPTPVVTALQIEEDDATIDAAPSATHTEDDNDDDKHNSKDTIPHTTTTPRRSEPSEVLPVAAVTNEDAAAITAAASEPTTAALPTSSSQPVTKIVEAAPVQEDDSIVTFRDSPSQSAAMGGGSLTNSVNAIGPFDANAIPGMLVQQPSLVNLPRQNSGSSSVETESSEEEDFEVEGNGTANRLGLDRAYTFPVSPRHSMAAATDYYETQEPEEVLPDPLAQLETNSEPYARMLLEKRMLHWDVALSNPKQEDYFGRTAILPLRNYYADTFITAICTEVSRHEEMDRVFITETEAELWETVIIKEGYTYIQELLVEDKASRFDRKLQNKLLKSMTRKALEGSSFRSGSSMRERSPTPDPHSHSTSSRQNGGAPLEPTLSMRSSASTAVQQLLNQQAGTVERKNSISGIRRSLSFNTTHNTTVHEEPSSLPPKRNTGMRKDSGIDGALGGDEDSPIHTLPSVTATRSGLDDGRGSGDGGSNSSSVIVAAISPHSIRRPTECFTPDARSTAIDDIAEATNPLNSTQSLPEAPTQQPSPTTNNINVVESGVAVAIKPLSLMNAGGGDGVGGQPARSSSPTNPAEMMPQFDAPADCSGEQVSKSGEDPMMMSSSPRPPKHSLRRLTQSLMALMPGSTSSRPLGTSRNNSRSVISRSKPQQRPSSAEAANRLREASMRVSTIHDMLDGNHQPSSGGTSPSERDRNNPQDQQIDAIRKAASNALDCSQLVSEPSSSRAVSPKSPRAASNMNGFAHHNNNNTTKVRESADDLIRSDSSAAMSIQSDDDGDEAPHRQHDGQYTVEVLKSKDSFSPAALQPFQQVQLQAEYDDEDDEDDDDGAEHDAEAALLAAEDEGIMTRLDVPIDGMAKDADVEKSVRIGRSVFDPTHEKLYHVVGEGVDEFAVEDDISSADSSESSSLVETSDDDEPSPKPQQQERAAVEAASQQKGEELNFDTGSATTSVIQDSQINGEDEDATTSDVLELLQGDGEEEDEEL